MHPSPSKLIVLVLLSLALTACGANAPVTPPAATEAAPPAVITTESVMPTEPSAPSPDAPSPTSEADAQSLPTVTPAAASESQAAASAEARQPAQPTPTLQRMPGAQPTAAVTTGGAVTPGLEPSVAKARTDLAVRLGLEPAAIELIEARSVLWPDRGVGCPRPGMAYQQVLTEGLFISLRVAGVTYNYHSRAGQDPFYCAQSAGAPGAPATPGGGGGDQ